MNLPTLIDGKIWSGHFIFVRDAGALSDAGFMEALGLVGYMSGISDSCSSRVALIARMGDWVAYADDGFHTAYNSAWIGDAIARLAEGYEVLRIAIGDADQSFEFYHFLDGSLRRAFHFHDYGGKSSIVLNAGPPFQCETAFQLGSDPWPYLWALVDEIGIDSLEMANSVSIYSKPYVKNF